MENKVSIGTRLKAAGKNTVSSYGSVLIAVIALSIVWSFASPSAAAIPVPMGGMTIRFLIVMLPSLPGVNNFSYFMVLPPVK